MKFAVITPVLNDLENLKGCIESVRSFYLGVSYQHIIVDGGSSDGLGEWAAQRGITILQGGGLVDSLNMGFKAAHADVFQWVNCDDRLIGHITQLIHIGAKFEKDCWVVAECETIARRSQLVFQLIDRYKKWLAYKLGADFLQYDNMIPQPSTFFHQSLFWKVGGLNREYAYAFDYDLWMKFLGHCKPQFVRLKVAEFIRHGGNLSDRNYKKQFEEQREIALAYQSNCLKRCFIRMSALKTLMVYNLVLGPRK